MNHDEHVLSDPYENIMDEDEMQQQIEEEELQADANVQERKDHDD